MTIAELIERAKRLAGAGSGSPDMWAKAEIDLAACVTLALHEMSAEVMRDEARRGLLQQVYSVTLDGSGVGDLLATTGSVTSAAGEILQDGVYLGAVVDADGNILQPLFHYADFVRPQSTAFGYYCLANKKIHTRAVGAQVNTPFDVQGASSPLTVTASYAPASVANVPGELEDDLVKKLVTVVMRKVEAPNA